MHEIIHFWNQRQILRRLVYNTAYFENLQKILRLAGGQITMASGAMKMTSKNHQKKSRCVLCEGAQICAFPTQNSKKVPLWNTLQRISFVFYSNIWFKNDILTISNECHLPFYQNNVSFVSTPNFIKALRYRFSAYWRRWNPIETHIVHVYEKA